MTQKPLERVPWSSPFAPIEGCEIPWLAARGAKYPHLAALVALRMWADWDTGAVKAGVPKLAEGALMPPSTFKRCLSWFVQHGVVTQGQLLNRPGLPRGYAHVREWLVRRYDEERNEYRPYSEFVSRSTVDLLTATAAPLAGPQRALAGPKRPVSRSPGDHHQDVLRDISRERRSPEKKTRRDDEEDGPVQERVLRWVKTRAASGLRFDDDLAGTWLAKGIEAALGAGHSEGDIDRAIARHLSEPYADPRELGAWVDEVKAARLESERSLARSREILAEREREEAAIAAERAQPGYAERQRKVYAEGLARLRGPREEAHAASTPLVTIPLVSSGTPEAGSDSPAGARVT